jgi:ferredoxin
LIKDFDLVMNILKAYVTPREEGLMVLELQGDEENYDKGIKYLTDVGVRIEPLSQDVRRNDIRCTHCGACVTICPTGALVLEPLTRRVNFYDTKCIACELCIPACPVAAIEVHF